MKREEFTTLWSLFWRSIVYFPLALLIGGALATSLACLFTFPILIAIYAYAEVYATAASYAAAWISILAAWRYFRLARFLHGPFGGL
ncbi:MAG TPA: hypothetical protein VGM54_24290 [Chthoniobacter sp.]|jgi:hypothetical protein